MKHVICVKEWWWWWHSSDFSGTKKLIFHGLRSVKYVVVSQSRAIRRRRDRGPPSDIYLGTE